MKFSGSSPYINNNRKNLSGYSWAKNVIQAASELLYLKFNLFLCLLLFGRMISNFSILRTLQKFDVDSLLMQNNYSKKVLLIHI